MNINEYNSFHDFLEKIAKQQLQIANIVAQSAISIQQSQLNIYIKSITPALTSLINSLEYQQLLFSTSHLAEILNKTLSSQLKSITNVAYDNLLKCDFSALKSLQQSILNINITNLKIDSLNFTNSGNIIYENEEYTPEQVNSTTSELVLKASTGTMEFSDIKKHPVKAISLLIIIYIIFSLVIPEIFSSSIQYIKANYFSDKSTISESDYTNFRIVTADVLNVRRNHSTDSDIIGKLYCLNVVKVIETYPYWLKIEYKDVNNNIQITGWICKKFTMDFSHETENLLNLNSD